MSVDLSKYTLVLDETFEEGLSTYDGTSGIWGTGPRYDRLVTNGPKSVFVSEDTKTSTGEGIGLNPFSTKDGVLTIDSGLIPDASRDTINDALTVAGQASSIGKVEYYTGMISTEETWGQTYGFYEMTVKVPAGKGHWAAGWLSPATQGWPPEIDIFEAYGKGLGKATGNDNEFNVAVFFDETDVNGDKTQSVDITNPYHLVKGADGTLVEESPTAKKYQGEELYNFHHRVDAAEEFGADIYGGFWTYAVEWTPTEIVFYFGKDHDSLVEIYRTPTPEDVNSLMGLIINDQLSGNNGWWDPEEGLDALTFADNNKLQVDSVKIYALNPEDTLAGSGIGAVIVDGDAATNIKGTTGNDIIVTGDGQDIVSLGGGTDTLMVERGTGNKIVSGFGADDKIVLEGFFFDGVEGAMKTLTQAGSDVWLINGADPFNPQTISFKDASVSDFSVDNFVVRWSVSKTVWTARLSDGDGDGFVYGTSEGDKLADAGGAGKGIKTLVGGEGGDRYFIYSSKTQIVEAAGGGVDTVHAYRDYVLPENVENILNAGNASIRMTGNALGNRLEGNDKAEIFEGGAGDDLIVTGGGADRIIYRTGDGHDTVVGFGTETVVDLTDIAFADYAALKARLTTVGHDTVLDLGEGQSITFRGVGLEAFTEASFSFKIGASTLTGHGFDPWYVPSVSAEGVTLVTTPREDAAAATPPIVAVPLPAPVLPDSVEKIGTEGADRLFGGSGVDHLLGLGGDDLLRGFEGDDELLGGAGDDTLAGGTGDDFLSGDAGADRLFGDEGNDTLNGGAGDDFLYGGDGKDLLSGGAGNDMLRGEAGDDILFGDDGDDVLKGDEGNDVLEGGAGSDKLWGGAGSDLFVFTRATPGEIDEIKDYSRTEGDRIDLTELFGSDVGADNLHDYVFLTEKGRNVMLSVDLDGPGSAHQAQDLVMIYGAHPDDIWAGILV